MKRITLAALFAAALFNADDANAGGFVFGLTCGGMPVQFEQSEGLNRITVNGYQFPTSGGTRRMFDKNGGLITLQLAGTDVDHQVAIVLDSKNAMSLVGWGKKVLTCKEENFASW